jgi:hypothetical protein
MHGPILAFLTLLFFLRVLGQALVVFAGVNWLPASHHWFSGLIPYPTLLAIQIVMLAAITKIFVDVWRKRGFFSRTAPAWHKFLIGASAVYAGAMVLRYVLTMIFQPEMRWLGGTIPIFFHFVLAGFICTWGNFHSSARIFARGDRAC